MSRKNFKWFTFWCLIAVISAIYQMIFAQPTRFTLVCAYSTEIILLIVFWVTVFDEMYY